MAEPLFTGYIDQTQGDRVEIKVYRPSGNYHARQEVAVFLYDDRVREVHGRIKEQAKITAMKVSIPLATAAGLFFGYFILPLL